MPKFRVSLFSLALMLAVPFAPQAVAKTAAATTASQPEIASGSAMIVDLNTNKVIYSNHPDLVRPPGFEPAFDQIDVTEPFGQENPDLSLWNRIVRI